MTKNHTKSDLNREQIAVGLMLLGFAMYVIWDQFFWWGDREDYSFGYLVPLFAAYVIYDRWPAISRFLIFGYKKEGVLPGNGEPSKLMWLFDGLAVSIFMGSILLFLVGALLRTVSGPQNPASLAISVGFAGVLLSSIFILSGNCSEGRKVVLRNRLALTAMFLFPALIWLISAPLVSVLETKIRVILLMKVTTVVFNLFDIIGYDIQREGNVLLLPNGNVGVEEACSGIRSLTACLFSGSFLAAVFLDKFWKKLLLVGVSMLLAFITNMMRSAFLTLWAYNYGSDAINSHWVLPLVGDIGSVHDVTGYLILILTCVGLLALLPIFNIQIRSFDEIVSEKTPEKELPD